MEDTTGLIRPGPLDSTKKPSYTISVIKGVVHYTYPLSGFEGLQVRTCSMIYHPTLTSEYQRKE